MLNNQQLTFSVTSSFWRHIPTPCLLPGTHVYIIVIILHEELCNHASMLPAIREMLLSLPSKPPELPHSAALPRGHQALGYCASVIPSALFSWCFGGKKSGEISTPQRSRALSNCCNPIRLRRTHSIENHWSFNTNSALSWFKLLERNITENLCLVRKTRVRADRTVRNA